ncbi:MAG TPA: prepilin-type N-terminal cleavage/methylation domain-containing protein [Gemmatimonadaceae bacterium]|jgi:prepilin-type N-terminal cleavage/methylation domain-containing protein|nr:prepilin-type N-terminal cleavage/methylation domain-containing protein [Gemmatimonadaceae bacterium]
MLQNKRKGFTLIELLIVVVIIGILAAIAIPKFANTKEKAYLAAMKTDLRNLVSAQEGYFADNTAYFAGVATSAAPAQGYAPTEGVTVTIIPGVGMGWSATAVHTQAPLKTCTIFGGGSTAVAPATVEGAPVCQ